MEYIHASRAFMGLVRAMVQFCLCVCVWILLHLSRAAAAAAASIAGRLSSVCQRRYGLELHARVGVWQQHIAFGRHQRPFLRPHQVEALQQ